jgi:hypothetical protein
MVVRESVSGNRAASAHIVQFFDSAESRAESVAAFLAEGYRAGEPLIVIARAMNWALMSEALDALEVPVQKAMASGRLVVRDASDTLRRLSRNGSPSEAAFETEIAVPVSALSRHGRVRAYGEMVDLLAQRTEFGEAIALEELWNGLGDRVPLFLMCGYSAAHFVSPGTHRALRDICGAHGRVHRDAEDPLAVWVLNSAHDTPGQSAPLS